MFRYLHTRVRNSIPAAGICPVIYASVNNCSVAQICLVRKIANPLTPRSLTAASVIVWPDASWPATTLSFYA